MNKKKSSRNTKEGIVDCTGNQLSRSAASSISKMNLLFDRVVSILELARNNIVRSVNTNMVLAYWLIGREIVEEIQGGAERAEYGNQVLEVLSARLTQRYGKGFSTTNLKYFRLFYQTYAGRMADIRHPSGDELAANTNFSPPGKKMGSSKKVHQSRMDMTPREKQYPAGSELAIGFSPWLSWSHYRALMRVEDDDARLFYEREAAECGWSKAQLERQIQSS